MSSETNGKFWFIIFVVIVLACVVSSSNAKCTANNNIKGLLYYTLLSQKACLEGLPSYILVGMDHFNRFQQASSGEKCPTILFLSNPSHCFRLTGNASSVLYPSYVEMIDVDIIKSEKHRQFQQYLIELYPSHSADLWLSSMLRFFAIEDLMRSRSDLTEVIHFEADNLIYGDLSKLAVLLRANFNSLAATQISAYLMTASVFWVNNVSSLEKFNNFLLTICNIRTHDYSTSLWYEYIDLLGSKMMRKRIQGGFPLIAPNMTTLSERGVNISGIVEMHKHIIDPKNKMSGLPTFSVNEMTLLSFYKTKYPTELQTLPLFPSSGLAKHSKHCKFTSYSTEMLTSNVSLTPSLDRDGSGIFDAGSYGQFLGGIMKDKSRRGYIDTTHIIGKGIIYSRCFVSMRCTAITSTSNTEKEGVKEVHDVSIPWRNDSYAIYNSSSHDGSTYMRSKINLYTPSTILHNYKAATEHHNVKLKDRVCITMPYVECCAGGATQDQCGVVAPLWNLHIHSKNVTGFVSVNCVC